MSYLWRLLRLLGQAWWRGVRRLKGLFRTVWFAFLLVPLALGFYDFGGMAGEVRVGLIIAYFIVVAPILIEVTAAHPVLGPGATRAETPAEVPVGTPARP